MRRMMAKMMTMGRHPMPPAAAAAPPAADEEAVTEPTAEADAFAPAALAADEEAALLAVCWSAIAFIWCRLACMRVWVRAADLDAERGEPGFRDRRRPTERIALYPARLPK